MKTTTRRPIYKAKQPLLVFFPFSLFLLWLVLSSFVFQGNAGLFSEKGSPKEHAKQTRAVVPPGKPAYGLNFINSAEDLADEQQFQNGLSTGVTWDRWPLYWNHIEQKQGKFNWARQDLAVDADVRHGLQINAILLGTPVFYTNGTDSTKVEMLLPEPHALSGTQIATPVGLYSAVFSDGTDTPGPGKRINPANRWARFVYRTVNRYKPGGTLSQVRDWPVGAGITHWEMWNEPDLPQFWNGTTADYARLLAVGYLAAKHADPNAQVIFGGLANTFAGDFYRDVMTIYDADPVAPAHGYYHDIVAMHNYLVAWRSGYYVQRARDTLAARGLDKPVWLNETGVPVWDDYPGPVCEPHSPLRATMSEQADFIIQSALYAAFARTDKIFFFRLYDGCGNQPAGTNFHWYAPDVCNEEVTESGGDAYGLFRNPPDSVCYSHHPLSETARPALQAVQLLTTYFTHVEPLWQLQPGGANSPHGSQEWLAFYRTTTGERILALWTRFDQAETAVVPATGQAGNAILLSPDGVTQPITATNGFYTVALPPATNQNAIGQSALFPIGGRPLILVERDTLPPAVAIHVPVTATARIEVSWTGEDWGSGMHSYDVAVAYDGQAAVPWLLDTIAAAATFEGEPGQTYTFTVTGRDRAGNVSQPVAITVNTIYQLYLPSINKAPD
ncbi:MAG TPA: hypothetical protein VF177_14925 [Anaerolineae bacterium]